MSPVHHDVFATMIKLLKPVSSCQHLSALPAIATGTATSVGAKDVSSTGWFALADFRRLQWILQPQKLGHVGVHRHDPLVHIALHWTQDLFHDQGRPIFLARLRLDTALPSIGKTKL